MKVYDLADRINVIDEFDVVYRVRASDIESGLLAGYTGMLRYKTDEEGLITSIEIPLKYRLTNDSNDQL